MIFPVLDARVTIAGAPIIVSEAAYPYEPVPEVGAEHWLFGVDDDSLVPFGGGATLTAQGASHVFASNYVTVSVYAAALLSNIADQATQAVCRVFKYQPVTDKNVLLLGNVSAVSNGYGVWLTPGGSIQTLLRGNTPAFIDHGVPSGVVAGDWLFIGYSERVVEGVTEFNTFIASAASYSGAFTGPRAISSPNRTDAIGNAYQSGLTYSPAALSVAESIMFPGGYKSTDELAAIYARSKKRMASRGITVI